MRLPALPLFEKIRPTVLALGALTLGACASDLPIETPTSVPIAPVQMQVETPKAVATVTKKIRQQVGFNYPESCEDRINRRLGDGGIPEVLWDASVKGKEGRRCGIKKGVQSLEKQGFSKVPCDTIRPDLLKKAPFWDRDSESDPNFCRHAVLCLVDNGIGNDRQEVVLDVSYIANPGAVEAGPSMVYFYFSPFFESIATIQDPLQTQSNRCFVPSEVEAYFQKGLDVDTTKSGWVVGQ